MSKQTYIGQLNERITIQRDVAQKSDVSGSVQRSWQVLRNCWAKVEDVLGSESIEGRVMYLNTKLFTIRYDRSMLMATDRRVEYMGRYYNIISIQPQGRKQWMVLKATLEHD